MPYAPVLGREEARRQAPSSPAAGTDRNQLTGAIAACQQQLADLLARLDATSGANPDGSRAPIAETPAEVAPARTAVEATLQRLNEVVARDRGTVQLTEFEERVWRRLVDVMRADSERIETALRAELDGLRAGDAERGAALEERVWQRLVGLVRADAQHAETALRAELERLRGDVEIARREQTAAGAELRDSMEQHDARRATEIAALSGAVARLDAEWAERQAPATDQVGPQLAAFETRVWQRLVETIRADGRRIETAFQSKVEGLRGEVAAVRREQAAIGAELRGAIVQRDAVRATEVAALGGAIERLEAHVSQAMATVDDRIVHHVRRARIAVEEEMAVLRHWIEITTANATGGVWSALAGMLGDPLGTLAAVVRRLPGF